MEAKYKFGHRPARRRRTRIFIIVSITTLILGAIGTLVWMDLRNNRDQTVTGSTQTVTQALDENQAVVTVDEPTFRLQLPANWKEAKRVDIPTENSVTWVATGKNEANRALRMYVDRIPKDYPVNQMLPLSLQGNNLIVGEASGNCRSFTKSAVEGGRPAAHEPAKWQGLDFICDVAQAIDNEIGTGSTDGINVINITGPTKGKHTYFFVYIDHNIQPNPTIFYDALKSFKAK